MYVLVTSAGGANKAPGFLQVRLDELAFSRATKFAIKQGTPNTEGIGDWKFVNKYW